MRRGGETFLSGNLGPFPPEVKEVLRDEDHRLAELVDRLDRAPASVLDAAGGLFDRRVAPDQVDVRPSGRHLNGDR